MTGKTNFGACFTYIRETILAAKEGTRFSIIFLTDGNETCNESKKLVKMRRSLQDILKVMELSGAKASILYCLGFSEDHDAVLLNNVAQMGSEMGNFIYIDTKQQDYI